MNCPLGQLPLISLQTQEGGSSVLILLTRMCCHRAFGPSCLKVSDGWCLAGQ